MGSLKHFYWHDSCHHKRSSKPPRRLRRFWWQLALSVLLVLVISATISGEDLAGQASRHLMAQILDTNNGWWGAGELQNPAVAEQDLTEPENQQPEPAIAAMAGNISFIAPASGVVVRNLALDVAGFTTEHGILIQGAARQSVRAAAAGEVTYLGQNEGGFTIKIRHIQGFISIYQGLSEVVVSEGQVLNAGTIIGYTESGEILFLLFSNDKEVDPLVYLFQQTI